MLPRHCWDLRAMSFVYYQTECDILTVGTLQATETLSCSWSMLLTVGRQRATSDSSKQNNASLTDPHYACTDDRSGSLSCRRKCSPMYLHSTVAVYRWLSQNRGAAPEKRVHRFRERMRFLPKEHRTANRYLLVRTVQAQVQHKALRYVVLEVPHTVTLLSGKITDNVGIAAAVLHVTAVQPEDDLHH